MSAKADFQPMPASVFRTLEDLQEQYTAAKSEANQMYGKMKDLYKKAEKLQDDANAIRKEYGLDPMPVRGKQMKRKLTEAQVDAKELKFE